jgi:2,3-bisphosphoglycerate-dependent phosphoglycerate mutase
VEKRPTLVLVGHGQSQWNKENRFTGWVDIDLSEEGVEECRKAAAEFRAQGIQFDIAFTSELRRGWRSLDIILEELGFRDIPVVRSATLNERHYGELQGMNKDEARVRFGEEQVRRWRRGFHDRPLGGESLADVSERAIPFFKASILSVIKSGCTVLVVAHGNSLRALVKHLEGLNEKEIMDIEFSTGEPTFYSFEDGEFARI